MFCSCRCVTFQYYVALRHLLNISLCICLGCYDLFVSLCYIYYTYISLQHLLYISLYIYLGYIFILVIMACFVYVALQHLLCIRLFVTFTIHIYYVASRHLLCFVSSQHSYSLLQLNLKICVLFSDCMLTNTPFY